MNFEVRKYDLPDISIFYNQNTPDLQFFVWQPDQIYLVIGSSNKPENSLILENVIEDNIPVLKRPSGGETVILTPKTLVLSTLFRTEKLEDPPKHFKAANEKIIKALEICGVKNLSQKGISDIAIGEKKILGSSIYRKTNIVFYHAVLNVSESTEIMERYIAHPTKQPDYRNNRRHGEFVTSILAEGYIIDKKWIDKLAKSLN